MIIELSSLNYRTIEISDAHLEYSWMKCKVIVTFEHNYFR